MLIVFSIFVIIACFLEFCSNKRNRYLNIQKELWFLCRERGIENLKTEEDKKKFEKLKNNFLPKYHKKLKLIYIFTINNYPLVEEFENIYQEKLKIERKRQLSLKLAQERREKLEEERQERLKLEKLEKERKEYFNKARKLYEKCKSIEKIDDETFRVLSYTYGINDIDLTKKMYKDALKDEKDKLKIKKENDLKKKLKNLNKEEKVIIDNALKVANKKFKDRYSAYKSVDNSLIDEVSINDINNYLDIDFVSYRITLTGKFSVSLKCILKKKITILNKPGILDGTFKIIVKDSSGSIVSLGYFNGFDDKKYIGFSSRKYSVLCDNIVKYEINRKEQYNIEIVPMYFWILEK